MSGPSLRLAPTVQQSLKQHLSPEMKLSFELLQMNQFELETWLQQEASENPFLHLEEVASVPSHFRETVGLRVANDGDDNWIDRIPDREAGLYEQIFAQIRSANWPENLIFEAEQLVPLLDQHGMLPEFNPFTDWDQVRYDEAVRQFQRLEPAGIGARSVCESLLLQAADRGLPNLVDSLIESHLQDLADGKMDRIMHAQKCTEEDLREAIRCLRSLSPYPINFGNAASTSFVRPDVVVESRGGTFQIAGGVETRIRPELDDNYRKVLQTPGLTSAEKKKLRDQHRRAQNLLKFYDLRESTVLRVARILIREQAEYLNHGSQALRPLNLRMVAEELGLHESTVSRATQGKTMLTDRGLVPFRNFFVQRVSESRNGEDEIVGSAVQEAIIRLIEKEAEEHRLHPYSDQELVEILTAMGLQVARRTVAKYRAVQNIPSRSERRRQYRLDTFTRGKS